MQPNAPIRLFGFDRSGHSHRVKLFLSLLRLPVTEIEVDLRRGAHKEPAFLARNPFGQVPVIEDGAVTMADSNAILVYLATRYDPERVWLPTDAQAAGAVQRWLSVAAGPLAAGPGAARLVTVFGAKLDLGRAQSIAHDLFAVLEAHLSDRTVLVGGQPSIADIALYSYTAHAPEGGVMLDDYQAIRRWLAMVEALPGFVAMPASEPRRSAP